MSDDAKLIVIAFSGCWIIVGLVIFAFVIQAFMTTRSRDDD